MMMHNEESRYEREKHQLAMLAGCYKMDKQEIKVDKGHLDLLIRLAIERNELLHEQEKAEEWYLHCDYSADRCGFMTQSKYEMTFSAQNGTHRTKGTKMLVIPAKEEQNDEFCQNVSSTK